MDDPKRLGCEAFEVEWCDNLPVNEFGDAEMDKATYKRRYFHSKQIAEKFARIVFQHDKFGAVQITPVRLEDPLSDTEYAGIRSKFRWEPTGDSFEYSGE